MPVQRTDHPTVAVRLQPGVDVEVQQRGLLAAHPLEVGERDPELVGELPTRQVRHAVFVGDRSVSAADIDQHLQRAALGGAALKQGERHDEVALGGHLALEFASQIAEGVSGFHEDCS